MMRVSGSFAVDLKFVLGQITIKGYNSSYLASYLLSNGVFYLTKFSSYLAPLL